jgi:hypothetical protein
MRMNVGRYRGHSLEWLFFNETEYFWWLTNTLQRGALELPSAYGRRLVAVFDRMPLWERVHCKPIFQPQVDREGLRTFAHAAAIAASVRPGSDWALGYLVHKLGQAKGLSGCSRASVDAFFATAAGVSDGRADMTSDGAASLGADLPR